MAAKDASSHRTMTAQAVEPTSRSMEAGSEYCTLTVANTHGTLLAELWAFPLNHHTVIWPLGLEGLTSHQAQDESAGVPIE